MKSIYPQNKVRYIFNLVIAIGVALWHAIVDIAWGISVFFLLGILITYYSQDASIVSSLLIVILWLETYWQWFFAIIFIYYVLVYFKELKPNEKVIIHSTREIKK